MRGTRPVQALLSRDSDPSRTADTRRVIEAMVDALNDHRIDDIGEFFAEDFVWHGNCGCGTKRGLAAFQDNWQRPFQAAFSDKVAIDEARLYMGEWGACFGAQHAVHSGPFMGIAPTGKKVEIRYMDFWKVRGGKIVENWVSVDFPGVMAQLGEDVFDGEGLGGIRRGEREPPPTAYLDCKRKGRLRRQASRPERPSPADGTLSSKRVTATDVARRAGVSQSAVSRVFTPGASFSERTAAKVRKAADELGYRPNVLARSLITGRSRIIGLVVAYLENYFYPEALEKLSNALQAEGYHLLVFLAPRTAGDIEDILQEIIDYQVDGIILASVALSSQLATRCRAAGIPVVLFNRSQDGPPLPTVTSDNFSGGREVARYLAAGGHRRIGYIAGWEGASTQRDREAAFGPVCARPASRSARARSATTSSRGRRTRQGGCSAAPAGPTGCSWRTTTWRSRPWTCCASSWGSASRTTSPSWGTTTSLPPLGPPTTSPRSGRRHPRWWRRR